MVVGLVIGIGSDSDHGVSNWRFFVFPVFLWFFFRFTFGISFSMYRRQRGGRRNCIDIVLQGGSVR